METDPTKAYNQDDATGFIRLNGLRLKVAAKVQRKKDECLQIQFIPNICSDVRHRLFDRIRFEFER